METNSTIDKIKISFIENWNSFVEQVPNIVVALLIIVFGLLITNLLSNLFKKVVAQRTSDPLMTNFLTKSVKIVIIILILMFALNVAGLSGVAAGILTAAGASALIFGFAFKDIGENFISGVILSFNRPFNVNDTVEIGDVFGKVKSMEFRYTKLKIFDGRDVYIPNGDVIKKAVFNYTEDGYFRLDFIVGIAYEDKIEDAEKLILQTIRKTDGVIEDETHEAFVAVEELGVSTVNLKIFFWIETLEYRKQAHKIKSEVVTNIKEALIANGLSLPADIKEIKLYGSQTSIPVTLKNSK